MFCFNIKSLINKERLKVVAISVFLICMFAHGFVFFNEQLSHDSITLMYNTDSATMISGGRFLRPLYNMLKGYFCYPSLNGLLSVVYLIVITYFVVDIFNIKNKLIIVLISAVLSTNYSVSLIYATYMHDCDAYMFSLLLATLGIWVYIKLKYGAIISLVLFVASMSIYQSYIQFSIFVFLVYLIIDSINNGFNTDNIKKLLLFGITIAASMALYYICFKVALYLTGITASGSYQSPSQVVELSLNSILERFQAFKESIYKWFILPRGNHRNWVAMVNKLVLAIDLLLVVYIFLKKKCNFVNIVFIIALIIMCPIGMNAITIVSNVYHDLTIYSFHFLYITPLILISNLDISNNVAMKSCFAFVCLLLSALVYDNCLYSNEIYLKKNLESKTTLMTITRIIDRIEQTEGYVFGDTPVAIIGTLNASDYGIRREGFDYTATGLANTFSISYSGVYSSYIKGYLNYPINLISESERIEIEDDDRVKNMAVFPSKESVAFIDDILVVKLSDYE